MSIEFLDPTHENATAGFTLAPRMTTLEGAVIVIISNGKKGTLQFFDAFERELVDAFGVAEVVRITKGNYSTPVEAALLNDAQRWNALVAGIGD